MISALISYICLCVFALGVTGILVIGPMIIALQDENCYFLSIIQVFFIQVFFGMFDILLVLASLGGVN